MGTPSRQRLGGVVAITLLTLALPPSGVADTIPLYLSTSTTLEAPAGEYSVTAISGDDILGLTFTLQPAQGTFSFAYNNQLDITWNGADARRNRTVGVNLNWNHLAGAPDFGRVRLRQVWRLVPRWSIDFAALYEHSDWDELAVVLPIPNELREGRLAAEEIRLEILDDRVLATSDVADCLVLGGAYRPEAGDWIEFASTDITVSASPYPCLVLELAARVTPRARYTLQNVEACVRYASDPSDTNCWSGTDDFDCIDAVGTLVIPVATGCEDVRDLIVPFCPVVVQGGLTWEVGCDYEVTALTLRYECSDFTIPPLSVATTTPASVDLFSQNVSLEPAREDAIFTLEVDTLQVAMAQPQETSYATDSTVPVSWGFLDSDTQTCCTPANTVVDLYFDTADGDDTAACAGVIASGLAYTNHGYSGWTPGSGIPCVDGSTEFKVMAFFRCGSSGVTLAHATSAPFVLEDPSPPATRWR